jgi:Peptidase S24-like
MRETRDIIQAAQLSLVAEILAAGGTVRLRALGTSMLPSVWPGDILSIEGAGGREPIPGDIVLVARNQRPFIHRLKATCNRGDGPQWITRGDAVPGSDPPAAASELLGRVALIERNRRTIVPRRRLSTTVRSLAWMLCHCARLRSVCLRMHSWRQGSDGQLAEDAR